MATNDDGLEEHTSQKHLGYRILLMLLQGTSVLLFLLGLVKLSGLVLARGEMGAYLDLVNPVIVFLPNRVVLTVAAMLEIGIGWYGFREQDLLKRSVLFLWLSSTLILYKILLGVVDYDGPCGCLFGLSSLLPLETDTQRTLADLIVLDVFFLGLVATAYCWGARRNRVFKERVADGVKRGC